ncbi:TetR/AcrR family transcriptional regulator [Flexithrix dorotheae]|uniref:TetR/AcrR family transcriptional regulator n=1 Tax=Flexithrix dorotheae TaxID=70993 RepID=UPI00036AF5C0|nr:TetR/AcrR family transcriptional regulator [Flexithrix dorotheae]
MQVEEKKSIKDVLIEVTAQLLEQKGYYGTGVAEILEKAGIKGKKGSMYHHFKTKDELVVAAINHAGKRQLKDWARVMRNQETAIKGISALIDNLIDRLIKTEFRSACPVSPVALEISNQNEEIRKACSNAARKWETSLATYLELNGIDEGERRAKVIFNLIEGAFLLSRIHHDVENWEAIRESVELILDS